MRSDPSTVRPSGEAGAVQLVLWNRRFPALLSVTDGVVAEGASFENILRANLASGILSVPDGDVEAWIARRLEQRVRGGAERELRLDDGRWIRVVERLLPDGGRVNMLIDVSLLKEVEARLESVIRGARAGAWTFDLKTRQGRRNDEWGRMLGLGPEDLEPLTFKAWKGIVHPDDLPRALELIERCIDGETAHFELRHRLRHRDGHWVWVRSHGGVVRGPDGTAETLAGVNFDISERVGLEEGLAELTVAVSATQDGIAVTDPEGRFAYMNAAHLAMFGVPDFEAVAGRHWSILYPPESAKWLEQIAFPILLRDGAWRGEIVGRRLDGGVVEQEVSLTRLADGRLVCVTRDVSARHRQRRDEARLREALQASQKRELIGLLTAGLAHEVNNMLAVVSGAAELIGEAEIAGPDAAMVKRRAGNILTASKRGLEILARLGRSADARRAGCKSVDLRDVIAEATELLRIGLPRGVRITSRLPDAPVVIEVDPTDIVQIVINLGLNARDALPTHSGDIRVELAEASASDLAGPFATGLPDAAARYCVLSVSDTGAGLAPDAVSKLFQPHFSSEGEGGRGFGLAMVAQIVRAHHGAIAVDSEPGQGSAFRILLPLASPKDGSETSRAAVAPTVSALRPRPRVLVAEDNRQFLEIMTAFLTEAGMDVSAHSDPRQALAELEAAPDAWDLLITDHDMPYLNGNRLAEAAAKIAPRMPRILVTAVPPSDDDDDDAEAEAQRRNFSAILAKPVRLAAILNTAKKIIEKTQ